MIRLYFAFIRWGHLRDSPEQRALFTRLACFAASVLAMVTAPAFLNRWPEIVIYNLIATLAFFHGVQVRNAADDAHWAERERLYREGRLLIFPNALNRTEWPPRRKDIQ